MSLVAVADRTGSALGWLSSLGDDHVVVPVDKPTEIGLTGPSADVLVLGPKEVSAAGLRRVATWKSTRAGAVVAFADDEAALRSADVLGVVDAVVVTGSDAAGRLRAAVLELATVHQPAPVVATVDMESAMSRLRRGRAVPAVARPVTLRFHPGGDESGSSEAQDLSEVAHLGPEYSHEDDDQGDPVVEDALDDTGVDGEADSFVDVDDTAFADTPQADEVGADEVGGDVLNGVVVAPPQEEPRRSRFPRPGQRPPRPAPPTAELASPTEVAAPEQPAFDPAAFAPPVGGAVLPTPALPSDAETSDAETSDAETSDAGTSATDPQAEAPAPAGPGQVITVAAASGGCGKTLYSTNLAAFLAGKGLRVLLIDLDLQFGEVAMALRLRHPYSIYDGLYDPQANPLPDTAFTEHVGELVVHSELGFDVLCAPRDPRFADAITSEDAAFVIEVTRLLYDVVVIDTPPSLAPVALAALDRSSAIAVLVTLDVPSLRNLASYLDVLSDRAVDESLVKLLVNKVEPDIGLDVKGAQEAFGGRFQAELPADRSASRSVNKGVVVVRAEPKSALAKAITASFTYVLPPGLNHLAAPPKRAGFFSRFRKSDGG